MVGAVKARVTVLDDLKTERSALGADLARLGQPEPAAVLHARVKALEHDRRWSSSQGCTNATIVQSRRFCVRYRKAVSALAGATRADQIRTRVRELTDKIRAETNGVTVSGTRRGMHLLADQLGMPIEHLVAALMIAFAVAVELAGVVAWSVASGYVTAHPVRVSVDEARGQHGHRIVNAPDTKTAPPAQSRLRARRSDPTAHDDGSGHGPEPVSGPSTKLARKRAKKSTRSSAKIDQSEPLASSTNVTPIRPRKLGLTEQLGGSVSGPTTEQFSRTRLSSSEGTQLLSSEGSAALAIHAAEPLSKTAQEDPVAALVVEQLMEVQAGVVPAAELLSAVTRCTSASVCVTERHETGHGEGVAAPSDMDAVGARAEGRKPRQLRPHVRGIRSELMSAMLRKADAKCCACSGPVVLLLTPGAAL